MATYKKISDLAEATVLNSDDELLITQSGISKRLAGELLQEIDFSSTNNYVRFSSGLQICWGLDDYTDITTAVGALYSSVTQSWTSPATFVWTPPAKRPHVWGGDADSQYIWMISFPSSTSNVFSYTAYFTSSLAGSRTARLMAIGYWK